MAKTGKGSRYIAWVRVKVSLDWLERAWGWLVGAIGQVASLVAVGLIIYGATQLFFGADEPAATRSGKLLVLLNDNWRGALLVLLIPLYQTLKAFVDRIRYVRTAGLIIETAGRDEPLSPSSGNNASSDSAE